MNELVLDLLRGAITGALIGYFTNDLAVRMLFRPRREWRIFGRRVPLTPGLVVRNQEQLAAAIGRAVSADLLDSETLMRHLRGVRLRDPIRSALDAERAMLLGTDRSLVAMAGPDHRAAFDGIRRHLAEAAAAKAEALLRRAAAGEGAGLPERLGAALGPLANLPLGRLVPEDRRGALAAWLQERAANLAQQPEVRSAIAGTITELLREFPGSAPFSALRDTAGRELAARIPETASSIQQALAEFVRDASFSAAAQDRLGATLYQMLAAKFPRLGPLIGDRPIRQMLAQRWEDLSVQLEALAMESTVGDFLKEQLALGSERILDAASVSAEDPMVQAAMTEWLAGRLAEKLPEVLQGDSARGLALRAIESLSGETPASLVRSLGQSVDGSGVLREAASRMAQALASDSGRAATVEAVEAVIDRVLLDQEVSRLMALVPDTEWNLAAEAVSALVEERILAALPEVLRTHLDLEEVVSARVREFDAARIEETIHRVSGNELKSIVNLGAVLGFVVGAGSELIAWMVGG